MSDDQKGSAGNQPEAVEDRATVSTVTPDDYPESAEGKQPSDGAAKPPESGADDAEGTAADSGSDSGAD